MWNRSWQKVTTFEQLAHHKMYDNTSNNIGNDSSARNIAYIFLQYEGGVEMR